MLGAAAQLVAVGVDVGEESIVAARCAARLAEQRSWDLLLVHAHPRDPRPGPGAAVVGERSAERKGEALLDAVLREVRPAATTRVHRLLTAAPPVDALRRVSALVSVLVLGRRDVRREDGLLPGHVGGATVAGTRCPALVVPAGWQASGSAGGTVAVALDPEADAAPVLSVALDEARTAGTDLLLLRPAPEAAGARRPGREEAVDRGVAAIRRELPALTVRTMVLEGAPPGSVSKLPTAVRLLVLGQPNRGRHAGTWARPVAVALVDARSCPALVVPAVLPRDVV